MITQNLKISVFSRFTSAITLVVAAWPAIMPDYARGRRLCWRGFSGAIMPGLCPESGEWPKQHPICLPFETSENATASRSGMKTRRPVPQPHASIRHRNKMARSPQRLRGKKGAPAKATPVAVAPRPGDRRRKATAPESASKKARSTPSKRDYRQPTPGSEPRQ